MRNKASYTGLGATSEQQLAINEQVRQLIDRKLDNDYTEDEKKLLRQYRGAGGSKAKTASETLFEFYTPEWLCSEVWRLVNHFGYDGGAVLEPSCATGNFFANAPDTSKCVGYEVNKYTSKIAQALYPKAKVYNEPFEDAFLSRRRVIRKVSDTYLEKYPFSLVLGNPPFGAYSGIESAFFKRSKKLFGYPFKAHQFESMFIFLGLMMLKKGGLLAYVLPQSFLRNGEKYTREKETFGEIAELVTAVRMPPLFKATKIATDILILRRK